MTMFEKDAIVRIVLRGINNPRMYRDDVARDYSMLLRLDGVDFSEVNRAIMHRWSVNALKYIKKQAWRQA